MRKWLCILLLAVGCQSVASAEDGWGVEHKNMLNARGGFVWLQDQYLSPLLYSGYQVGFGNEWWQGFKDTPSKSRYVRRRYNPPLKRSVLKMGWLHMGKIDVDYGWCYSDTYTNLIYSLGINGGWGACSSWKWLRPKLELFVGPYLDVNVMGKLHVSNVNKPYSMDFSVNACAMGGASWSFMCKKKGYIYRLRYLGRLNVIGMDYLPDYWHSYFEMGEGVFGDFRCAGLWNHRHFQQELTFDMQFTRSAWRIGARHEYLEYGTSNMMFSRESVSVILGCIWQYKVKPTNSFFEL